MASADNIGSKPPECFEGGGIEILERGDSVALGAAGSSTNVVTNPTSVREDSERESSGMPLHINEQFCDDSTLHKSKVPNYASSRHCWGGRIAGWLRLTGLGCFQ